MGIYDFEVLKDDTVIAAKQAIALPDARAAHGKSLSSLMLDLEI